MSSPAEPTPEEAPSTTAPEAAEEETLLKNLAILPPTSCPNLKPIEVPSLRPDEPVTSIRAALAELVGYAHITNYQLSSGKGKVMDDYGDLVGLEEGSQIQMELKPYQTIREHVLRLQQLLEGNPPVVKSLVDNNSETTEHEEEPATKEGSASKSKGKQKKNGQKSIVEQRAETKVISPITLDNFFGNATGEIVDKPLMAELSELENAMMLTASVITISYLAPPSSRRKLLGDLAYLRIQLGNGEDFFVTAIPSGFYVNKSTSTHLDPTPVGNPCLSHALLDCLLQASPDFFAEKWYQSLAAAQKRLTLTQSDSPLQALHRVAVQTSNSSRGLDAVLYRPSWMVPAGTPEAESWPAPSEHTPLPLEAEYPTFGLDLTSGVSRDWNEELQSAREMPIATIQERLERARVIHKVLLDFGDAAFKAAKAIHEGHISPMNPNEATRSHVYLHNSIFVSRAVDAGVETFKMSQGDRAAKKAASRDAMCMSFLHRMDVANLYTLATVLVDFLGTRYVCQSIVPGILQGENTHQLMYGAVEASAPLSWESEMHDLLEQYVGKHAMCATRVQPTQPLTDERLKEVETLRTEPPLDRAETRDEPTTLVCGPIEGKGIKGSDQRCYVLDLTRLTPRDANWVPKSMGGTGKWEEELNGKNDGIPTSLEDDEWITAVLRQELVTQLTHQKMTVYLKDKEAAEKKEEANKKEETDKTEEVDKDNEKKDPAEKLPKKKELTPEDESYLTSLRFNVNVFLPQLRSLKGINDEAVDQLELDEEQARKAALHLWDVILPKMNLEMKEGSGHQLPLDGKSMVEFLHQRGINCRYMGRLAILAAQEEAKDHSAMDDVQSGKVKTIGRKVMPLSWLELLEVEMIARASKHVLDSYLNEDGGQTTQIIASFMSALMSKGEETAGESEKRISKRSSKDFVLDEDDLAGLTLHGSAQIRGRKEVWDDIALEIGRRFRYKLTLYNCGKSSGRAAYPTLLRRLCQRTGVRLIAKKYDLGAKCVCASKGGLTNSYPISPLDIFDVVPLMKHAGALSGEGFMPCSTGAGLPSLHILLPDAKATFEAAHFSYSGRALPQALELAQEAAALYQRVVDGPLHLQIARCLDLTAAILFEAGETSLAAANASRSLGLSVQLGGFDCAEAMAGHSTLSHILLSSQQVNAGITHLKAAAYLMELLAGPRYVELANCYYKIGSYYQNKDSKLALDYFKIAQSKPHSDRLAEGMMAKGTALLYVKLEQYRPAVDAEKRAYQLYSMLLGEGHELTLNSQKSLLKYTKMAVEQGNKKVVEEKLRLEEEAADAMASMIQEEEEKEKKKKKNKGKKKK